MSANSWHAFQQRLRWQQAGASLTVDPLDPRRGVCEILIAGQPLTACRVMGVDLQSQADSHPPVESYVRGGDLVATYAEQPRPAMRTQIYWRATSHELAGAFAALELVVSVQTSKLDSCPRLTANSHLPAHEALRLADHRGKFVAIGSPGEAAVQPAPATVPGCFLFRLHGEKISYVEMIPSGETHTSSCGPTRIGETSGFELRHGLFSDQLEKGVILRARILGLFLPRKNDRAEAARHYAAFLASDPPLTT